MEPKQIIYYTTDMARSRAFYTDVLGIEGAALGQAFTTFGLSGGWTLALWSGHSDQPALTRAGGTELVFELPDAAAVYRKADDWRAKDVTIVAPPQESNFGYSFVAQDPDGNRLRVGYFPQG